MYRLVFLTGPHKGRRLAVRQGDVLIGSDPDCHVQLFDPAVSSRHALLEQRPDGCFIRALGPSGAIRVNGVESREEALKHGDEIDIASERLLFQLIQSDSGMQKRRRSKFHGLTFVAVSAVLIVQLVILAGLFLFWRMDPIEIPVVEEVEVSSEPELSDAEIAILERRMRARADGAAETETSAEVSTEAEEAPGPAPSFELVPEWIVTPHYEPAIDSRMPLDEGSASDVLPAEEE